MRLHWACLLSILSLVTVTVSLQPPVLPGTRPSPTSPPQTACRAPRSRGHRCGHRPALRWYLDEEQGDCLSFWFAGCGGNPNNFPSAEACREVCVSPAGAAVCLLPASRGPCTESRLLWTFDSEEGQCVTFVYGGCYGTANRFFTRRQCERACLTTYHNGGSGGTNPGCLQRAGVSGQCAEELVRYTFLATANVCAPFLYRGCAGNDNNFKTLEECRDKCQTADASVRQTDIQMNMTTAEEKSSTISNSDEKYPKENTAKPNDMDICFLPRDPGSCLSYAPMFYYDVRTTSCHQFIYRGCGGNANRFHTRSECLQRCEAASTGAGGGAEAGVDSDQMNDTISDIGGMVSFGDVAVNSNATSIENAELNATLVESSAALFDSSISAEDATNMRSTQPPVTPTTSPTARPSPPVPRPSDQPGHRLGRRRGPPTLRRRRRGRRACLLRPRPGPCHRYLPQFYYYNADLGRCFAFIYGGCGGNGNRFGARQGCERYCKGVRRRTMTGRRTLSQAGAAIEDHNPSEVE